MKKDLISKGDNEFVYSASRLSSLKSRILDIMPFSDTPKANWEQSTLRAKLNIGRDSFFECAFSEEEKHAVIGISVKGGFYGRIIRI